MSSVNSCTMIAKSSITAKVRSKSLPTLTVAFRRYCSWLPISFTFQPVKGVRPLRRELMVGTGMLVRSSVVSPRSIRPSQP
jgi:hypothetical protein